MNDLLPWILLLAVTLAWHLDRQQAPCPPAPSSSAVGAEASRPTPCDNITTLPLGVLSDTTATPSAAGG